jgi:hypothetical protein
VSCRDRASCRPMGRASMTSPASTKLPPRGTALAVAAFLLTSLPAFAQGGSGDSADPVASGDLAEPAPSESPEATSGEGSTDPAPSESSGDGAAIEATTTPPQPGPKTPTEPAEAKPYVGFAPPFKPAVIENETISLRLGLFAQPHLEVVGAPDADKTSKNLFLHNVGVIFSGRLFDYFEFFFDVNYPSLFKVDPFNQQGGTGKNSPGLNVQDAIVTFKPFGNKPYGNWLKFDAGFMLPSLSHNGVQGAFTLYGLDYFVNTFRRNVLTNADPFKSNGQSPQGRDAGVQMRGLLFGEHLEYRVGMFQGLRVGLLPASAGSEAEVGAVNFFRVAARLQINLLDAEPDFFYQGTYLGTKKILSFGGFYDFQDQYLSAGGDVILDLPVGPGILSAQANVVYWDGGNFIQTLHKHTAIMAEVGYLIRALMLSPTLRMEQLIAAEPTASTPSEARYGGGLAFWPWGHTSNFKALYTYVHRDPAPQDYSQFNVQWQVWF